MERFYAEGEVCVFDAVDEDWDVEVHYFFAVFGLDVLNLDLEVKMVVILQDQTFRAVEKEIIN